MSREDHVEMARKIKGKVPHRKVINHLDANLLFVIEKYFSLMTLEVSKFVSKQNLFTRLHRHKKDPMYSNIGTDLKKLLELITTSKNEMLQEMSFGGS